MSCSFECIRAYDLNACDLNACEMRDSLSRGCKEGVFRGCQDATRVSKNIGTLHRAVHAIWATILYPCSTTVPVLPRVVVNLACHRIRITPPLNNGIAITPKVPVVPAGGSVIMVSLRLQRHPNTAATATRAAAIAARASLIHRSSTRRTDVEVR